jgi:DASH complex subunit DAM1
MERSNPTRAPPSRPSTPLRPSSRTSLLRARTPGTPAGGPTAATAPLAGLEPAFAELADAMADLEANFMHLQLMHESLARFADCFAAFLYGLNMNAFCVDFPEVRWMVGRARELAVPVGGAWRGSVACADGGVCVGAECGVV